MFVMLTFNAKKPLVRSILFGIITIIIYLIIVIITTPALSASVAVRAAFEMNYIVIVGMGFGVGLQVYISEKSKSLVCMVHNNTKIASEKRTANSTTPGITAMTSFFSFFSLVPLGCCGWWLYVLSLLPSVFGAGVSAVLIVYSQYLAYMGLAIIFGFCGLAIYRYKKATRTLTYQ